ncbi:MAG: DUF2971 domain-containing protein [Chloroflexi bacterium]|nr:DUF2971 domain-containing protein [Chloroflexota bacterium]MYE39560.1 DUF2971 domain-containing protein [Chloroflexota bacterium]
MSRILTSVLVRFPGVRSIWPNFLNYYLRCVASSVLSGTLTLPGYHFGLAFGDETIQGLIENLASAFEKEQQETYDKVLSDLLANPVPLSSYELSRSLWRITPGEDNKILRQVSSLNLLGIRFIGSYSPQKFADQFVHQFGKLISSAWASVSFTRDFANPYLWSTFADNHAGACLIFDKGAIERLTGRKDYEYELELTEVSYQKTKPEVDFFAGTPFITVLEYKRLHTRNGLSSTKHISDDEAKTEERWQERFRFIKSNLLTKQKYYEAEQEIRLYCTTVFTPHGFYTNPGVRTIQYPITALKGIIFGSRMPEADMDAIREIMIAKNSASPLPDGFDFYKAESRPDGSIQKRLISPCWREEHQYPLKVREGI